MEKQILGIIPARGGSKGVPRKNIKLLAGRPLIVHTIEAALQSSQLDRIIVSTDDQEIAEVAREAGAEVPFIRPAKYATDTASSLSVLKHALEWVRINQNYHPDAVAVLAPTSPLRCVEHIDATAARFRSSGVDSAVAITQVQNHPYFIFNCDQSGRLSELLPIANKPMRRQELPDFFTHSQAVIVTKSAWLDRCEDPDPAINFQSLVGYEISNAAALDIDTPLDFMVAEMLLERERTEDKKVA